MYWFSYLGSEHVASNEFRLVYYKSVPRGFSNWQEELISTGFCLPFFSLFTRTSSPSPFPLSLHPHPLTRSLPRPSTLNWLHSNRIDFTSPSAPTLQSTNFNHFNVYPPPPNPIHFTLSNKLDALQRLHPGTSPLHLRSLLRWPLRQVSQACSPGG